MAMSMTNITRDERIQITTLQRDLNALDHKAGIKDDRINSGIFFKYHLSSFLVSLFHICGIVTSTLVREVMLITIIYNAFQQIK